MAAVAVGLAACTQSFAPSSDLLPGAEGESLYDRIVTRFEDPGFALPDRPTGVEALVPGDVLEVGYYLAPGQPDRAYRVGPNDVLLLDVADHAELTRERILVRPDGNISLPLLGSMPAAGETLEALSGRVEFLYARKGIRSTRATLALVESNSGSRGALKQLVAGGPDGAGRIVTVTIVDDMTIYLPFIEPVDARQGLAGLRQDIRGAYRQRFGPEVDVIVNLTERAPRNIYVLGEVNRAGPVRLLPGMTPLMAVAAAGGMTDAADPSKVILTRLLPDREYRYWVVNLKQGLTNVRYRGNTIGLAPQDVLLVPQSAIDEINEYIDKFVKSDLPPQLRRRLGLEARGGARVAPTTRVSGRFARRGRASCEEDDGGRKEVLTVAMIRQLREPLLSANFNSLLLDEFAAQKYGDAERLAAQSLALREEKLGKTHINVAQSLNALGLIYDAQQRYGESEGLYERALRIQQDRLGPTHPYVATTLENLATLYVAQCRYAEAEPLFQRALAVRQVSLGPAHGDVTSSLETYSNFLKRVGRVSEAQELEGEARVTQRR